MQKLPALVPAVFQFLAQLEKSEFSALEDSVFIPHLVTSCFLPILLLNCDGIGLFFFSVAVGFFFSFCSFVAVFLWVGWLFFSVCFPDCTVRLPYALNKIDGTVSLDSFLSSL